MRHPFSLSSGDRPFDRSNRFRRTSCALRLLRYITFYYNVPISIDRFESDPEGALDVREGTQPYRILRFLAENDDRAYTQTEIHEATDIKRGSVGAVLSRLEERGLVRHRGRYWAIAEDDRLASFAAQAGASSASTNDDYYGEE